MRFGKAALGALALLSSGPGPRAAGLPPPADLVWCPTLDQAAQAYLEANGHTLLAHPELKEGLTPAEVRDKIRKALEAAHAKGVRILDFQFLATPDMLQADYARAYVAPPYPPRSDPTQMGVAHANLIWLEEAVAFNRKHPRQPYKLRLRINATAANLFYLYRTLKPYRTFLAQEDPAHGVTRSRLAALPLDPCFEKQAANDPCFATSPVPPGYYRAQVEDGTWTNAVANLANPVLRAAIADWTSLALEKAGALAGNDARIEEVSLSLDAGSESSLFPGDRAAVVSFSDAAYAPGDSLPAKRAFFRARESDLKATYSAFASAVHAFRQTDGHSPRAGIFQQAWALDGRARGTFDLYALLSGTGIDVLHHTQMPMDSAESLMATAFSASVANALGIPFDTEFSWAHFNGGADLSWDASRLRPANAARFFVQAAAGLRYGARSFTYANWTLHEFLSPPPGPAWSRILGSAFPEAARMTETAPGNTGGWRGIYIGSAGRMVCEEKAAHPEGPGEPCDLARYFDWFEKAGLRLARSDNPLGRGRVAILTDGMLLAGKPPLSAFQDLFIPYETSLETDSAVLAYLRALPAAEKAKFRWQARPGGYGMAGFAEWSARTRALP